MKPTSHRKASSSHDIRDRIFPISIIFYAVLLVTTLALGRFVGIEAFATLRMTFEGFLVGIFMTLPAIVLIAWMGNSRSGRLYELRRWVQTRLVPLLIDLSFARLVALTALVGLAEEAFFRGFLQASVEAWFLNEGMRSSGPWLALVLASIVFGFCHAITRAYFVFATFMGLYLGAAWIVLTPRNLLVPIVIHSLYDFAAIFYLARTAVKGDRVDN